MASAINAVIDRFATDTYTVTRTGAGTLTDGVLTPGSESTITVVAVVQPMSGTEMASLQTLPEGDRNAEMRVVYTATELKTRTAATAPDRIAIGGESYEIVRVDRWDGFGAVHYKALASRLSPA